MNKVTMRKDMEFYGPCQATVLAGDRECRRPGYNAIQFETAEGEPYLFVRLCDEHHNEYYNG